MQNPRTVLTPDALAMMQAIADAGSLAAAARALGVVPSALSYRVRQIEDTLDVLLLDRSARRACLTPAGLELMHEGQRLLQEIDAVAARVRRVATGWEPQFTVAVDNIIVKSTVMDLCESFFALGTSTRLKLRDETLAGTLEALTRGDADLALGVTETHNQRDIHSKPLGDMRFVYAVAPHHPLARAPEPLSDDTLRQHRAVAVADSVRAAPSLTIGLLGGQDVFTVANGIDKLQAQVRGLGGGFLPACMAQPYLDSGRLVERRTERPQRVIRMYYAWRAQARAAQGRALQWWLTQLANAQTRTALLQRHPNV